METASPSTSPDPSPSPPAVRTAWRRAAPWLAAGAVAYLLFRLLSLVPSLVEATYGRALGPAVAWTLSRITAPVPFPVAEAAMAAYGTWLLALAVGGIREAIGSAGALGRSLGRGAARLARDGGLLLVSFYLLWGFHYARPSVEARLGLPDGGDASRRELVRLAERAVRATNAAYRAIHDTADAGEPTTLPAHGGRVRAALAEGWRRAAEEWGLPGHYGWSYGPVEAFVPDGALVLVGLGGFYFPWTGEAVVDGGTPASDLVQSIAHEQAHQRGVAPEDEASFMGFLAASRAPHPVARYSAYLFAQRHLMAAAASGGRTEIREELASERLPGVRRDLADLYAYVRRRIRVAARVTRRVNDAYLKSQQVEGGVASYGLVTRLLVAQARADGERLFPHRSQPAQSGGSSPK